MIYTAICGGFDPPRTDIRCFTEQGPFNSPRMGAKLYKALPHLFFTDAVTIWVDGNITPLVPEEQIIAEFLPGDANIGCFAHPWRQTIRQEISECLRANLMTAQDAAALIEFLGPAADDLALCESGMVVRRNCPEVNAFNALWWSLICRFTCRDQTTFPFAIANSPGIKLHVVQSNVRIHPMFTIAGHSPSKT